MLTRAGTCLKNYLYSDYESDKQDYGFWTIKGRVISIIDIPSQIAKAAIIPSMYLVLALYAGSAAGLRVTFKVIPQAILSITPGTDHEYWKNLSAANWSTAQYRAVEFAANTVIAIINLIKYLFSASISNIAGCTISPNFGKMERRDSAERCHEIETAIKYHYYTYQKAIVIGNEPIHVDIKQLNLPSELQQPMQDVVNEINFEIQRRSQRAFAFIGNLNTTEDPDPATATDDSLRNLRFYQYMRRLPGDTSNRQPPDHYPENSIMHICLQRLLEAGCLFSYSADRGCFSITA